MDEDGLFSADAENELDSERDRATPALQTNPSYALSCSLSQERTSHAQEQNSTADRVIIHPSLRRLIRQLCPTTGAQQPNPVASHSD
jgi:hypothetical protein